jgi:hypothetical protein
MRPPLREPRIGEQTPRLWKVMDPPDSKGT